MRTLVIDPSMAGVGGGARERRWGAPVECVIAGGVDGRRTGMGRRRLRWRTEVMEHLANCHEVCREVVAL